MAAGYMENIAKVRCENWGYWGRKVGGTRILLYDWVFDVCEGSFPTQYASPQMGDMLLHPKASRLRTVRFLRTDSDLPVLHLAYCVCANICMRCYMENTPDHRKRRYHLIIASFLILSGKLFR